MVLFASIVSVKTSPVILYVERHAIKSPHRGRVARRPLRAAPAPAKGPLSN
jgi:hypothetical protein